MKSIKQYGRFSQLEQKEVNGSKLLFVGNYDAFFQILIKNIELNCTFFASQGFLNPWLAKMNLYIHYIYFLSVCTAGIFQLAFFQLPVYVFNNNITVALQFPEGLLLFACTIADIIEEYVLHNSFTLLHILIP